MNVPLPTSAANQFDDGGQQEAAKVNGRCWEATEASIETTSCSEILRKARLTRAGTGTSRRHLLVSKSKSADEFLLTMPSKTEAACGERIEKTKGSSTSSSRSSKQLSHKSTNRWEEGRCHDLSPPKAPPSPVRSSRNMKKYVQLQGNSGSPHRRTLREKCFCTGSAGRLPPIPREIWIRSDSDNSSKSEREYYHTD